MDRWPNQLGNYEPGNVRWATKLEQARNRRDNIKITLDGVTRTLTEWSDVTSIKINTLRYRLKCKWDVTRMLTRKANRASDVLNARDERGQFITRFLGSGPGAVKAVLQ